MSAKLPLDGECKTRCVRCTSDDDGMSAVHIDHATGEIVCKICGDVLQHDATASLILDEISSTAYAAAARANILQPMGENEDQTLTLPSTSLRSTPKRSQKALENILCDGKKNIDVMADSLRIGHMHAKKALRYFKRAVHLNIVGEGYVTVHVVAICLYMAARVSALPYFMEDFAAEVGLKVNVFGKKYLRVCRKIGLHFRVVDPVLFVERFTRELNIGIKRAEISKTAVNILNYFRSEWVRHGLQPQSLVAAAIIIAGRSHALDISVKYVANIMRISPEIVQERLESFSKLPSAQICRGELATSVKQAAVSLPAASTSSSLSPEVQNYAFCKSIRIGVTENGEEEEEEEEDNEASKELSDHDEEIDVTNIFLTDDQRLKKEAYIMELCNSARVPQNNSSCRTKVVNKCRSRKRPSSYDASKSAVAPQKRPSRASMRQLVRGRYSKIGEDTGPRIDIDRLKQILDRD